MSCFVKGKWRGKVCLSFSNWVQPSRRRAFFFLAPVSLLSIYSTSVQICGCRFKVLVLIRVACSRRIYVGKATLAY